MITRGYVIIALLPFIYSAQIVKEHSETKCVLTLSVLAARSTAPCDETSLFLRLRCSLLKITVVWKTMSISGRARHIFVESPLFFSFLLQPEDLGCHTGIASKRIVYLPTKILSFACPFRRAGGKWERIYSFNSHDPPEVCRLCPRFILTSSSNFKCVAKRSGNLYYSKIRADKYSHGCVEDDSKLSNEIRVFISYTDLKFIFEQQSVLHQLRKKIKSYSDEFTRNRMPLKDITRLCLCKSVISPWESDTPVL